MDKLNKSIHWWVLALTVFWLTATYEHNFYTLHNFVNSMTVFDYDLLPASIVSSMLLVAAIDLTMFFGVMLLPYFKQWDVNTWAIKLVLGIVTIISMLLNIKYMVDASPDNSVFNLLIAWFVGGAIPITVLLFGVVEGNVITRRDIKPERMSSRKLFELARKIVTDNNKISGRQLGKDLGVSPNKGLKLKREVLADV